jgi:nicotinamide riboside transporter PnuC
MKLKKLLSYFSPFEWTLWITSIFAITLSFVLSGDFYFLTLIASLVGVSSLIFIAKGNVVGQFLIILFSILYGIISIRFRY